MSSVYPQAPKPAHLAQQAAWGQLWRLLLAPTRQHVETEQQASDDTTAATGDSDQRP